eukprot:m.267658 g.267658  ORF g.267658 m.267658 type:complete len:82 (+) comp54718_c0_seq21:186-431(+)
MNEFLACALGLARQFVLEGGIGLDEQLQHIQCNLIDVGSALASMSVDSSSREVKNPAFHPLIVKFSLSQPSGALLLKGNTL